MEPLMTERDRRDEQEENLKRRIADLESELQHVGRICSGYMSVIEDTLYALVDYRGVQYPSEQNLSDLIRNLQQSDLTRKENVEDLTGEIAKHAKIVEASRKHYEKYLGTVNASSSYSAHLQWDRDQVHISECSICQTVREADKERP